jgi:hypothetical protein
MATMSEHMAELNSRLVQTTDDKQYATGSNDGKKVCVIRALFPNYFLYLIAVIQSSLDVVQMNCSTCIYIINAIIIETTLAIHL